MRCRFTDRKINGESGAFAWHAMDFDFAHVVLYDAVHARQAQTSSTLFRFCRKERFEDPWWDVFGDSDSCKAKCQLEPSVDVATSQ